MDDTKKVFLLIVEGSSDKIALSILFDEFIVNHKLNSSLDFAIYGTDISTHLYNDPNNLMPSSKDPVENIKECILEFLADPKSNKNKFKINDIYAAASLSDLDCCFCSERDLKHEVFPKNALKKTRIDFENKKYYCNDLTFIKSRNLLKTNSLEILSDEIRITIDNHFINYKAFYNSVNLEHAFYNKTGNYTEDEKCVFADNFVSENIENKKTIEEILTSIPCLATNYKDSWDERMLQKNPFERCSNLIFILEWLVTMFATD